MPIFEDSRTTFTLWLRGRVLLANAVGDLARDARDDPSWPASGTRETYVVHLLAKGAVDPAVMRTLYRAFGEYEFDTIGFDHLVGLVREYRRTNEVLYGMYSRL